MAVPSKGVRSAPETPYKRASRPVPRPCRRSDFDVTDTVQVSRPAAVREAVLELYADTWPGAPRDTLETALIDYLEKAINLKEHREKAEKLALDPQIIKGDAYRKYLKDNEVATKTMMNW